MRITEFARLIARLSPKGAAAVAGLASPLAAAVSRRGIDAWESNLRAVGLDAKRRSLPLYHHLLLQYESLALIGGRRFDVEVRGEEHLHDALDQGCGLLVATAHVGNWHLGAQVLHEISGLPVHSIAGTQMFRGWTGGLRLAYRHLGIRVHQRTRSSVRLLRALRNREIVALHLDGDQHAGVGPATRGIALLARRTGAPILPAFTGRSEPGSMSLTFRPFLRGGSRSPDPESLAAILVDLVRHHPEQWTLFRPLWERT